MRKFFPFLLLVSMIMLSSCEDKSSSKNGEDLEPSVTQPSLTELPYISPPDYNGNYSHVLKDVDADDDSNYSLYEFDDHNNLTAIKSYANNLLDNTTRYEYDDSGRIIKYTWDSDGDGDADAFDSFATYEYVNSAISAAHFNAYLKGVGWVESPVTFKYEYFGSGGIQISTYRYDQLASYSIRVYDDYGNLIHRYEDGDLDGVYENQKNYSYSYDAYGNTIKMTDSSNGNTYIFEYAQNIDVTYGYYPAFALNPLDLLSPVVNTYHHLTKISFADSGGNITGSKNIIWETEESDTNETDPDGTDTNETEPDGTDTNETEPDGTDTNETVPDGTDTNVTIPDEPVIIDPCAVADANFTFSVAGYNYSSEIWVSDISPAVDPSLVPVCALALYWEFDNGYTYSGGGVDENANQTPGIAPSVDECNVSFTVTGTWENNETYTTGGIWSYSSDLCTVNDVNTSTLYRDDINEIVIDTANSLMWEDTVETKTVIKIWAYIKDAVSDADYYNTAGDTAATYCSELTLGGYTDWRLPTRNEHLLMISYSNVETLFTYYSPNNDYWTSETKEDTISNAYTVIFPSGVIGDLNKGKKANFRCVRDSGN